MTNERNGPTPRPGEHTRDALRDWGLPNDTVKGWLATGALSTTRSHRGDT